MKCLVDTNVPVVANNRAAPQASAGCVVACVRRLDEIRKRHLLVLDDDWHIIREYQHNLSSSGQPGVGDAFLEWVLTNRANPRRCEMVHITPRDEEGRDFAEFPRDPELASFDPSDRKFVAVAVAHPKHPSILNAVDSDWWDYQQALARHHVRVEFVCPDAPFMQGGHHGDHQL